MREKLRGSVVFWNDSSPSPINGSGTTLPVIHTRSAPAPATHSQRRAPSPRRRRLLHSLFLGSASQLPGAAAALALLPRPALAHHGFAGKYDFARPMYLAGRLVHVYAGLPHARLTLDVPEDLFLARDREWLRALEDAEARQTTTLLLTSDRHGRVDVSLDRRLTRRLMDEPGLLRKGDPVEGVVYRRITRDEYRNELQAVLIALPDGRLLVSSSPAVVSR